MTVIRTAQVGTPISFWFMERCIVGRIAGVNENSLSVDAVIAEKAFRTNVGPDQFEGILSFSEAKAECPALFPVDLSAVRPGTPVRFDYLGHEILGRIIRVNQRSVTVDAVIAEQPFRTKVSHEDIHALLDLDEGAQVDPAMFAPNVLAIPAPGRRGINAVGPA